MQSVTMLLRPGHVICYRCQTISSLHASGKGENCVDSAGTHLRWEIRRYKGMRMMLRSGLPIVAMAAALISLAQMIGCERAPKTPPTPAPRDPVRVLATVYPMADVVRTIG